MGENLGQVWLFPEMSTEPGFALLSSAFTVCKLCSQELPQRGLQELLGRAVSHPESPGAWHCDRRAPSLTGEHKCGYFHLQQAEQSGATPSQPCVA